MKFRGELKFPEVDHPGVPVVFFIDDDQAEILVDGESLGRWSLYDIHARRLVASAFQVDLDGTEVTFVADDPIDFAYRGVEHMAKTWAEIKSRRVGGRMVAVRKSRRGVTESRVNDLRAAMESNLADIPPRRIAGEPEVLAEPETASTPSPIDRIMTTPQSSSASEVLRKTAESEPDLTDEAATGEKLGGEQDDWDTRDPSGAIPVVGGIETESDGVPEPRAADVEVEEVIPTTPDEEVSPIRDDDAEARARIDEIEEERRRLAEERASFEEERRAAAEREENLLEAYRLEMQRIEAEREELRRQAAATTQTSDQTAPVPDVASEPASDVFAPSPSVESAPSSHEGRHESAEPEPVESDETEPEGSDESLPDRAPLLDLDDIGVPADDEVEPVVAPPPRVPRPEPEPALSGAAKEKRGLMGAVKAAFGTGVKDHTHTYVEAPGGLGITRYVCEECGYVSISSGH